MIGLPEKRFLGVCEPVLRHMKRVEHPVSIKEVAERLKMKYQVAKQRLHKLTKLGLVKPLRPGIYALHQFVASELKEPLEKAVIIRGATATVGSLRNSYRLLIYNCQVSHAMKGQYVQVERREDTFVVRRVSRYVGRKVTVYKRGNASVQVSRIFLTNKERALMGNGKTMKVYVKIYPAEFSLSISDALGTEAKEEGILAEALLREGLEVRKVGRRSEVKGDLEIMLPQGNVMIEITRALPGNKIDRSNIKSCEILSRCYYALRWTEVYCMPAFLIIDEVWKKGNWVEWEKKYLQKKSVYLLFSDFKGNWGSKIADELFEIINALPAALRD